MDELKMGFFKRLHNSITSFDKYRNFLRQSTSKAVVYLLLISLVIAAVTTIQAGIEYNRIIDEIISGMADKIPDFEFANGRLEVSGPMPLILEEGSYPIIIDTSPNADEKILDQYDTAIYITSDKIIQKNFVDKTVTDLSTFQGIVLNRDSIAQALPLMKPLGIFIFIFIGIFFVCGKFISALIVSLFGLIVNSARNTGLSYRSIFKISVYSMTLPLIICTIIDVIPVQFPYKWLLFYAIAFVYVFGAINNIKKEIDNTDLNNMNRTDGMGK